MVSGEGLVRNLALGRLWFGEELGVRPLADIHLHLDPVVLGVADLLAVHADRQQPLQGPDVVDLLLQAGFELNDPFAGLEPHEEFVLVERLGEEIVRSGADPLDDVLLGGLAGQDDDVHVRRHRRGPDPAHQIDSAHARHLPVGDEDLDLAAPEEGPGRFPVPGRDRLVLPGGEPVFQMPAGEGVVVGHEDLHPTSPGTSCSSAVRTSSNSRTAAANAAGARSASP